ncbi:response regulator transcription factor [Enterococcus faecalis]|uniref:response regulator transcription factor n=1 Tax=Enterococcus faecalis TaxID=1351 RepID=UPI002FBE4137
MEKIMIVDDDDDIRIILRTFLEDENYDVIDCNSATTALDTFGSEISLIVLDISMPEMDGLEFCRKIRQFSSVPILFLTARIQETDLVIGLSAGGDDYLSKPFSRQELIARVNALIRRFRYYKNKQVSQSNIIKICHIEIDTYEKRVKNFGEVIELAEIEYKILLLLSTNQCKIYSIPNLYESIWGEKYFYSSANTVMVHIRKLRKKIEIDPSNPRIIRNIWGKGYQIYDEEG